jgi:hypothetical protein
VTYRRYCGSGLLRCRGQSVRDGTHRKNGPGRFFELAPPLSTGNDELPSRWEYWWEVGGKSVGSLWEGGGKSVGIGGKSVGSNGKSVGILVGSRWEVMRSLWEGGKSVGSNGKK